MAALIEFVCIARHEGGGDLSITVEQRSWAYCAGGSTDGHEWVRIDPTAIEMVRSRPGLGRPYLVPDDSDERSLAGPPAR
jgi:hypothetical protein